MKFENNEIKFLIKPLGILFLIVTLYFVLFYFGLSQINAIRSKISEAQKLVNILSQKITVLESLPEAISGDITFLDVALPSKAASLYGLSQIKNQSALFNLILTDIKVANPIEQEGYTKYLLSFYVEGTSENVASFIESFAKVLPLMNVNKIEIENKSGVSKANVGINVYSAEYPTKIESVSSEIPQLTNEDIALIKEMAGFTMPKFIEPKAFEGEAKVDPFN